MRINTNVSAINAYNNLSKVQDQLSSSMAKLSSGFRINKAGDDAAGLGIANQLRGDIGAMQQASNNADQSMSVLQIMDGATQNVETILDRMKELAAQSASDTVDTDARTKINNEFGSLSDELDRIVDTTKFQGANLLDGSFGSKVSVGGSIDATASGSITGAAHVAGATVSDATKLKTINGAITASIVTSGNTLGTVTDATASVISGQQSVVDGLDATDALSVTTTFGSTALDGSATGGLAEASNTNVTAVAVDSTATADAQALKAGAYSIHVSATDSGTHSVTVQLMDANNQQVGTDTTITQDVAAQDVTIAGTGVKISLAANLDETTLGTALDTKTLAVAQTYNVALSGGGVSAGETHAVTDSGTAMTQDFASYGINLAVATGGMDALATTPEAIGLTASSSVKLSGTDTGGNAVTQTVALNANPAGQALDFTSSFGVKVTLGTGATAANLTTELGTTNKIVQGSTHQAQFLVSASQNYSGSDLISLDAVSLSASSLGVGKTTIDLTTSAGAQSALTAIDGAITKVGTALGAIGAAENRITYASSNVKTAIENFTAAESTIRDVDMASEMTNFSKEQILSQAGTAMLAQANQLGSSVLKLLQ